MSDTKKAKALNIPNALSILRMVLVPFFVWAVLAMDMNTLWGRLVPALIFAVTAFTDCLDGQIARRCNLITNFGKFLDPLADKFMVFAALVVMVYRYTYLSPWLVWATVLIMFRELAVTSIRLVVSGSSGIVIAANMLGKIKTCTQIACVVCCLVEPLVYANVPALASVAKIMPVSLVTSALMLFFTLWSGINYIASYWKYLDPEK